MIFFVIFHSSDFFWHFRIFCKNFSEWQISSVCLFVRVGTLFEMCVCSTIIAMCFRCLTNVQVGRRKIHCTKSPAFSFVSLARNHKHRFLFYFGRRVRLANRLLSSKAFFKCNCNAAAGSSSGSVLVSHFIVQICRTPSFVFTLRSRISRLGHLKCSSTDEEILLVVVYVRGMHVYPVNGFFSLQTRFASLQHIGKLNYEDVCVWIFVS